MLLVVPSAAKHGLIKSPGWSFVVSRIWRVSFPCAKVCLVPAKAPSPRNPALAKNALVGGWGEQVGEREPGRQLRGEGVGVSPVCAGRLCSEPL